jgi:hypothetical protein
MATAHRVSPGSVVGCTACYSPHGVPERESTPARYKQAGVASSLSAARAVPGFTVRGCFWIGFDAQRRLQQPPKRTFKGLRCRACKKWLGASGHLSLLSAKRERPGPELPKGCLSLAVGPGGLGVLRDPPGPSALEGARHVGETGGSYSLPTALPYRRTS